MRFWFCPKHTWSFGNARRKRPVEDEEMTSSAEENQRQLDITVKGLPWFGEQVSLRTSLRRRRGRGLSLDEEQRVLLAWLCGVLSQEVAALANVGRRTVYNVLHRLFYVEEPLTLLSYWADLGLIVGIVTPDEPLRPSCDLACLICHDIAAHTSFIRGALPPAEPTFRPDPFRAAFAVENQFMAACATQAHLIKHFCLEEDPFQQPGTFGWLRRALVAESAWDNLPGLTTRLLGDIPRPARSESDLDRALKGWRRAMLERRRHSPPPTGLGV